MRPYLAILTLRFREVLQYRSAAWAGVFTQVVFGFIIYMSISAFFASNPAEAPMTQAQLASYVWLGQAFFTLLPWNADRDVQAMVRSGAVAYELARPIDTYTIWFCRALGWRTAAAAARCLPLLVIVAGVFPLVGLERYALPGPSSVASAGLFLLAMLAAVLLGAAVTMLLHVLILWTHNIDGVVRILPSFVMLGAGAIIPLPLFPDWLQPFLNAQPFRGLLDVPMRIYSGHIPPGEALFATALTATWTAVLILLGRAIMARGFRQVVIHGG